MILKNKFFILFYVAIALLVLSLLLSNLSVFVFGLFGFCILFLFSRKKPFFPFVGLVFVTQCLFIMITYYGYLSKYGCPYYLGGSDDLRFENLAAICLEKNVYTIQKAEVVDPIMWSDGKAYVLFLSYLMRLCLPFGGYHTVLGRIANVLFLDGIALMLCSSLPKHVRPRSVTLFLLITLFPSCLYISVHLFRDVFSAFLLVSIFTLLQKAKEKGLSLLERITLIGVVVLLSYLAYFGRSMNLIFILIIAGLFVAGLIKEGRYKKSLSVVLLLLLLIVAAPLGLFDIFVSYNNNYSEYISGMNNGFANLVFSLPLFPLGGVVRVIYGLFFPSPTALLQFPSAFSDIDAFWRVFNSIGTLVQLLLFFRFVVRIRRFDDYSVLAVVLFLSVVLTTFGFRHFIYFYPFFFRSSFSDNRRSCHRYAEQTLFSRRHFYKSVHYVGGPGK